MGTEARAVVGATGKRRSQGWIGRQAYTYIGFQYIHVDQRAGFHAIKRWGGALGESHFGNQGYGT